MSPVTLATRGSDRWATEDRAACVDVCLLGSLADGLVLFMPVCWLGLDILA